MISQFVSYLEFLSSINPPLEGTLDSFNPSTTPPMDRSSSLLDQTVRFYFTMVWREKKRVHSSMERETSHTRKVSSLLVSPRIASLLRQVRRTDRSSYGRSRVERSFRNGSSMEMIFNNSRSWVLLLVTPFVRWDAQSLACDRATSLSENYSFRSVSPEILTSSIPNPRLPFE